MNELDFAISITLLISVLIGLARGFIKETLKLINLVVALFGSFYFKHYLYNVFKFINSDFFREIIAKSAVFILIFISGNFLIYLIYRLINLNGISKLIDKILGICFGFGRFLLIAMMIIFFIDKNKYFLEDNLWQESLVVTKIRKVIFSLEKNIHEPLKSQINELVIVNINNNNNNNNNNINHN